MTAVRKLQLPDTRNGAASAAPSTFDGTAVETTSGQPEVDGTSGQVIAYLRVSTRRQDVEMQRAALAKLGPARWFEDVASGKLTHRPGLDAAMQYVRPGDTFTVYSLSRASRSLRDLLDLVTGLEDRGVHFRSLLEPMIDTSSPTGRLVLAVLAALAQYERELTVQRVRDGQDAARAAGRSLGRPPALRAAEAVIQAQAMRSEGGSIAGIARVLGVSRTAVRRALESTS